MLYVFHSCSFRWKRGGIRARGLDHAHRVGIRVLEFALDAGNLELRDLLVAEASVLMELEDNVPGLREEASSRKGFEQMPLTI